MVSARGRRDCGVACGGVTVPSRRRASVSAPRSPQTPRRQWRDGDATRRTAHHARQKGPDAARQERRHLRPSTWRFGLVALLLLAMVGATLGAVVYRRQIGSWLTHRKGSPTHTEAYRPFPADDLPDAALSPWPATSATADTGWTRRAPPWPSLRVTSRSTCCSCSATTSTRREIRPSSQSRSSSPSPTCSTTAPTCSRSSATTTSPTVTNSSRPSACRALVVGAARRRADRRARFEPVERSFPAVVARPDTRGEYCDMEDRGSAPPALLGGIPGVQPRHP